TALVPLSGLSAVAFATLERGILRYRWPCLLPAGRRCLRCGVCVAALLICGEPRGQPERGCRAAHQQLEPASGRDDAAGRTPLAVSARHAASASRGGFAASHAFIATAVAGDPGVRSRQSACLARFLSPLHGR